MQYFRAYLPRLSAHLPARLSAYRIRLRFIMVRFMCPMCGVNLRIPATQAGKALPCPACEHRVIIPPVRPAKQKRSDATDVKAGSGPSGKA